MSNIELYVKDGCEKSCDDARRYVNDAIQALREDGIGVVFNEYNIDTPTGRKKYNELSRAYLGKDLGLPLTAVDGELYVGVSIKLTERIVKRVLQRQPRGGWSI